MAWGDLAANQGVSFNNLQSGVTAGQFTAKTTIPSSTEMVTKSDAITYVNIDENLSSFSAKSSNQLVVKSNLQAPPIATIIVATNTSEDIALNIYSITVNGAYPLNHYGADPNVPGYSGSSTTDQIGTYTVTMTYEAIYWFQRIYMIDSAGTSHCGDVIIGTNTMTFTGVVINSSVNPVITCAYGTCGT